MDNIEFDMRHDVCVLKMIQDTLFNLLLFVLSCCFCQIALALDLILFKCLDDLDDGYGVLFLQSLKSLFVLSHYLVKYLSIGSTLVLSYVRPQDVIEDDFHSFVYSQCMLLIDNWPDFSVGIFGFFHARKVACSAQLLTHVVRRNAFQPDCWHNELREACFARLKQSVVLDDRIGKFDRTVVLW